MKSILKTLQFLLISVICLVASSQAFAADKITFYHYDLLGSPVATTNELGEVVWREEYSPYGDKLLKQDADQDNVRGYTGHVFDEETGLTYMQARYYDAQIGRFMGVDPVGFQEGDPIYFNRYAYAGNNPYKFIDPNGESYDDPDAPTGSDFNFSDKETGSSAWGEITSHPGATYEDWKDELHSQRYQTEQYVKEYGVIKPTVLSATLTMEVLYGIRKGKLLSPEVLKNIKKFMKKIPANSKKNVQTHDLPNNGVAIQATSPASNIPGSKAVYDKQIDGNGNTVQYTKTTYDGNGNIVHVKDKLNGAVYE